MEIDGMNVGVDLGRMTATVDTSVLRSTADGRVVESWSEMYDPYITQSVMKRMDVCNARIDEFLNMLSKISEKLSGKECEELSAFIDGCISEFKKNDGDS